MINKCNIHITLNAIVLSIGKSNRDRYYLNRDRLSGRKEEKLRLQVSCIPKIS